MLIPKSNFGVLLLDGIGSTLWQGVTIVGATVVVALALFAIVVKVIPTRQSTDNGLTEFIFSILGALYGLLLAFVVVIVYEDFSAGQEESKQEITKITNLLYNAGSFDKVHADSFKTALIAYTDSVANDEWEDLADTTSEDWADTDTETLFDGIWNAFHGIKTHTPEQTEIYSVMAGTINELGDARDLRVLDASSSLPVPLWILILAGGVITMLFTYFFHTPDWRKHAVSVSLLAVLLGFCFFIVYALQYPYSGDISTKPDAYREIVEKNKEYAPINPDYSDPVK